MAYLQPPDFDRPVQIICPAPIICLLLHAPDSLNAPLRCCCAPSSLRLDYVGYCRTIIMLLGEGPEGEVGRGRGPRGRLAGCRLRGVSPRPSRPRGSRLAARGSPRLAPRLARLARVYEGFTGFTGAVTVTGAAAVAVTVAVAVRGSGYVLRCVSRKERDRERERGRERERESLAFPGNIYQYLPTSPFPPPGRPAGS